MSLRETSWRSVVVLDEGLFEGEVFLLADDLLLAGAVEIGELLADAGFVFAGHFGAAEATGETARNGDEDDAGEEGSEVHLAKFQIAAVTLAPVASAASNFS